MTISHYMTQERLIMIKNLLYNNKRTPHNDKSTPNHDESCRMITLKGNELNKRAMFSYFFSLCHIFYQTELKNMTSSQDNRHNDA